MLNIFNWYLACWSAKLQQSTLHPFSLCAPSVSVGMKMVSQPDNKLAPLKDFFWAEFKHFGFFPHEPSMWPSLSMCISTTEHAFFGLASTWLHLVSKLLAITLICFGKCVTCFWKLLMRYTFSLCVLLHLFPVPVWEPIVCWTGVFFFFFCQPWQRE